MNIKKPLGIIISRLRNYFQIGKKKIIGIKKRIQYEIRGFKKRQIVINIGKQTKCKIFIETSTYLGEMVNAIKNKFSQIYSIELSPNLCKKAQEKFRNNKKIKILCGDSGKILPQILKSINEPVLFWLDAHYSSGVTARGDKDTPIIQELEIITNHHIKDHTILIDDARFFNGQNDYPQISYVEKFIKNKYPNHSVEIHNDIIQILNKL